MKYCAYCGNKLLDEAVMCPNCKKMVGSFEFDNNTRRAPREEVLEGQPTGLQTVAKIFMIISTIIMGFGVIPLAWCLPMTLSYSRKIREGEPVTTGFKICTLLFVNTIAGILMLLDNTNNEWVD